MVPGDRPAVNPLTVNAAFSSVNKSQLWKERFDSQLIVLSRNSSIQDTTLQFLCCHLLRVQIKCLLVWETD